MNLINFLNTELTTAGGETIRLLHIPFMLIGLWLIYMFFSWLYGPNVKKTRTFEDAQELVKKRLGSNFTLFPPGNNNPKYTITYNAGGEGDPNIAIARGKSFKSTFELARGWVGNNYVYQQLGPGYFVLLPDAGNDYKYILIRRSKGTKTGEVITTAKNLQELIERSFIVLKPGPGSK